MVQVYRTTDRSKPFFVSSPTDATPYTNALQKLRYNLKLKHPMLVLKDIAEKAEDVHLAGSHYQESARQLLQLVFKASGYDLEEIVQEVVMDPKVQAVTRG